MVNRNRTQEANEVDPNEAEVRRLTTPPQTKRSKNTRINMRQGKSAKKNREKARRHKGHGKHKGGKTEAKGEGSRYFFPEPDCDGPIVKMQNQMEICKLKGESKITMDASETWIWQMRSTTILDKMGKRDIGRSEGGGIMRKTDIPTLHTVAARREDIDNIAQTEKAESEEMKDRKSHMRKIKEMPLGLRKCEIYSMLSGYREMGNWFADRLTFVIHGGEGCEIWFRMFIDLPRQEEYVS